MGGDFMRGGEGKEREGGAGVEGKKKQRERERRRNKRLGEEEEQGAERKVYSLGQAVKTGAECITLMPGTGVTLSSKDAVGERDGRREGNGGEDRGGEEGETEERELM